jgi:RNA polymerase sigma-70 factor (ECF subfamily)
LDRELVERAMGGDHAAFAELARVSAGRLLVLARLILRDEPAAEDAAQDALVAAWRHIRGLRDPDRFDPWLHRLLVNSCHREARRARSRATRDLGDLDIEPADHDDTGLVLDRDQLDRGFSRLDINQRTVVVLYYYVGLRPDEAAKLLGWPVGTVRSRLQRAIDQLRAALAADARAGAIAEERAP